jgi:hypothetical protein
MPLTLTLTLERRDDPTFLAGDYDNEPPPATITITSADLEEDSVHRWFRLFEQVLILAGYKEASIIGGACGLAFNDARDHELMRKTAHSYDLAEFFAQPPKAKPGNESRRESLLD